MQCSNMLRSLTSQWRHSRLSPQHTTFCRRLSSKKIRSQFLDFFRSHDHVFVPSSSVVPSKDDGSYFVNAGMNQFKPIFLGTTEPGSDMAQLKRAVNSQKCIRVGGKHNDLKDVGRDLTHHTFFEMLGSWSFGDYFKREACVMAWQLLTEVYKIPADQLLVTYFGGNTELGLEPDEECREIWLSIGVPGNRVFPLGMKDNFWDMGDCGPCGPCTEIHLNRGLDASANLHERLMAGDPGITELWNLVFMQFNREFDGSLRALPACHVDTGMGLERLAAVLQGVSSNYDTDLFRPIFEVIQQVCDCPPYGGATGSDDKHGIDTAYRIIADHSRMLTVAMGDGLVPGRKGLDARVRHIMYRAFMHGSALNAPRGLLADLVPVVVDSLGEAFPELVAVPHQMQDVILTTEQRYSEQMKETEKSMKKALKASSVPHQLSTQEAERIVKGFYGSTTNADLLSLCAESMGVQFDVDAFHNHGLQQVKETSVRSLAKERPALNQYEVEYLLQRGVPPTDDTFKYSTFNSDHPFERQFAKTAAILNCDGKFAECGKEGEVVGVILDRSAFYSEGGGQVADQGEMTTVQGCRMQVLDVQKTGVFVLHTCRLLRGSLSVGESVIMHIDQDLRHKSACNHTATHLLNFALRKVLDCDVWQAGSSVNPERLVFEFRSLKTQISADEIERISDEVNKCINEHSEVYRSTVALRDIEAHPHLVKLDQEVYPNQVAVISVGRPLDLNADESSERYSLELCGGTHVQNTADIGGFVISHFHGSGQGTKKVTALTGASAKRAEENGLQLTKDLEHLEEIVNNDQQKDWHVPLSDLIEKAFSDGRPLPKVVRDQLYAKFEHLKWKGIRSTSNQGKAKLLLEEISTGLSECNDVIKLETKTKMRDVLKHLATLHAKRSVQRPLALLFTSVDTGQLQGVLVNPVLLKGNDFNGESWLKVLESEISVQSVKDAVSPKLKGKLDGLLVWSMIAQKSNELLMDKAVELTNCYLQHPS